MTRREGKGKKEGEKKSMQLIEINGKMRNSVRTQEFIRETYVTRVARFSRY